MVSKCNNCKHSDKDENKCLITNSELSFTAQCLNYDCKTFEDIYNEVKDIESKIEDIVQSICKLRGDRSFSLEKIEKDTRGAITILLEAYKNVVNKKARILNRPIPKED